MIRNGVEFDAKAKDIFQIPNFKGLVTANNKTRVELGGDYVDEERGRIAYHRASKILNDLFVGKDIGIRISLWDGQTSLNFSQSLKFQQIYSDFVVAYYHFNLNDIKLVSFLIKGIINNEIGLKPTLNATCFYFNFDIPAVVNIYDDRGMDIVKPDINTSNILRAKYSDLII